MFHNLSSKAISNYDVTWKKFKRIILIISKISNIFLNFKNKNILITFDDGYSSQLKAARYLSLYFKMKSIIKLEGKWSVLKNKIKANKKIIKCHWEDCW